MPKNTIFEFTADEFAQKLKDKEIVIEPSLFYPNEDSNEIMLESYLEQLENHRKIIEKYPDDFKNNRDNVSVLEDGYILFPYFSSNLNSRIYDGYIYLSYLDNKYQFTIHQYYGERHQYRLVTADKIIPPDITGPTNFLINLPTGNLVFANWFNNGPEPKEDYDPEYSVNTISGRRNLAELKANGGVGYGQMGNMSIGIYANEKEVIVTDSYVEETISSWEEILEEPEGYEDVYLERAKNKVEEGKKLLNYLEEGKFKYKGELSLSLWRWEATDKSNLKTMDIGGYDEKIVMTKLKGTKVAIQHYYNTFAHGESPISSFVYSHLKVTE